MTQYIFLKFQNICDIPSTLHQILTALQPCFLVIFELCRFHFCTPIFFDTYDCVTPYKFGM